MASTMEDGIVLSGYNKKLKTMKKKFFVLYKATSNNAARLEYYDTEKKFNQRSEPKRTIYLKNCFNINRRFDTKYKFVLALSSREGGFGIVLDNESELRKWLENFISLQKDNAIISDQTYPPFEHVWQVLVQKKGISDKVGIFGSYHCCLTPKSLTFICIGSEKTPNGDDRIVKVEILLTTIRRCGHASPQGIFYMELGRQSVLGSGELWMETEDAVIARHMHDMILSAMSAKTEGNMNLINVSQGKPEINHEPMRKRSSSANEASKPINVLQKRQMPMDIRSSISPQTKNYGRERCDSLPTRNRTLSECSNQSYIASNHAFRSNTISGFRPYSCQRHSNSPPLCTPLRCSESEESSISIDETDDNASFNPYRLNTRSSKGVIPEENVEELTIADNKCNKIVEINENLNHYIPMTPIKATNEIINANQSNQLKQKVFKEELSSTGSKHLLNLGNEELNFDFPEHTSEKLVKDFDVDSDSQCERPTRAYSIGSKIDTTKTRTVIGNVNEIDKSSPRVRAFSVGSRSKIPRCDLQRGALFAKVRKDQNVNGSNSNITIDLPTCNEVIGYNSPREKKSTSAPLLNLKSQMNTERMSDLMEIDFSKVTAASSSQNQPLGKMTQVPKSIQNAIRSNHKMCNVNPLFNIAIKQDEISRRTVSSSVGGYLEMKPVGNTYSNSNIVDIQSQMNTLNLVETQLQSDSPPKNNNITSSSSPKNVSTEKSQNPILASPTSKLGDSIGDCKVDNKIDYKTQTSMESTNLKNNRIKNKLTNLKIGVGPTLRSDEYISLDGRNLANQSQNLVLDINCGTNKVYVNDDRKLTHSISNEDYTHNTNQSISDAPDTAEGGYKILQIKSDSSLISTKKNQKPHYKDKFDRYYKNKLVQNGNKMNRVHITNTSIRCNLSLTTPESQNIPVNANSNTFSSILDKNSSPMPPSVTSEHGLYYASLDLPQCSGQHTNRKEVVCESPPVEISPGTINSYAKIDFDHSDSSSSSSKVCNL